jgi:hypothetical protein
MAAPPETRGAGQCETNIEKLYGECGLTVDTGTGTPTQQEAVNQCVTAFPPSSRCAGLCAACNVCGSVASCVAEHCGEADRSRCAANVDHIYVSCGQSLASGDWMGTAYSQTEATAECSSDPGLATCINDCVNTNAGRRACDDLDDCLNLVCWIAGQRGPGTAAVPQPCPSSQCRTICDALSGMDATCPDAARSLNACLEGCEALLATSPQCVSCIETWSVSSTKTCESLAQQIEGCSSNSMCVGRDFEWAR